MRRRIRIMPQLEHTHVGRPCPALASRNGFATRVVRRAMPAVRVQCVTAKPVEMPFVGIASISLRQGRPTALQPGATTWPLLCGLDARGSSPVRPSHRHCEERSDEAIQTRRPCRTSGLLRFARNNGIGVSHGFIDRNRPARISAGATVLRCQHSTCVSPTGSHHS